MTEIIMIIALMIAGVAFAYSLFHVALILTELFS